MVSRKKRYFVKMNCLKLHIRVENILKKTNKCMMHMIMNNLDPGVAQFPQKLITYGGNGQVFANWAQVGVWFN